MPSAEMNRHKATLQSRQAELLRALRDREDIAIQKVPDQLDEVQLATERELAIRELDRESRMLRRVNAALARIREGTYGTCLRCDEKIPEKRLHALPWAEYCVRCQEAADAEASAEPGAVMDEILVDESS